MINQQIKLIKATIKLENNVKIMNQDQDRHIRK